MQTNPATVSARLDSILVDAPILVVLIAGFSIAVALIVGSTEAFMEANGRRPLNFSDRPKNNLSEDCCREVRNTPDSLITSSGETTRV